MKRFECSTILRALAPTLLLLLLLSGEKNHNKNDKNHPDSYGRQCEAIKSLAAGRTQKRQEIISARVEQLGIRGLNKRSRQCRLLIIHSVFAQPGTAFLLNCPTMRLRRERVVLMYIHTATVTNPRPTVISGFGAPSIAEPALSLTAAVLEWS